jgi:hypothetical protein
MFTSTGRNHSRSSFDSVNPISICQFQSDRHTRLEDSPDLHTYCPCQNVHSSCSHFYAGFMTLGLSCCRRSSPQRSNPERSIAFTL